MLGVIEATAAPGRLMAQSYLVAEQRMHLGAPTLVASTSVDGLTPAKIYYFRFRTFTRDGFSAWSPAVSFIAH
jgi:hypothetical protein